MYIESIVLLSAGIHKHNQWKYSKMEILFTRCPREFFFSLFSKKEKFQSLLETRTKKKKKKKKQVRWF